MRRAIGLFIGLFFLPCAVVFQGLFAVQSWLFNPQFFADFVNNPQFFDGFLAESGVYDTFAEAYQIVQSTPGEEVLLMLAPQPAEISRQTSSLVRQYVEALEGQINTLSLSISATQMRDIISGPQGRQILQQIPASLPSCPPGANEFQNPYILEPLPIPYCIPAGINVEALGTTLASNMDAIVQQWPATITYLIPVLTTPEEQQLALAYRNTRDSVRGTMTTVGFFAVLLLAGSTFTAFRPRRMRAAWAGVFLLLPGLFVMAFGSGLSSTILSIVGSTLSSLDTVTMSGLSFAQSIVAGFQRIGSSFVSTGLFFVVIGALLLAYGLIRPATLKSWFNRLRSTAESATSAIKSGEVEQTVSQGVGQLKERTQQLVESEEIQNTLQSARNQIQKVSTTLTESEEVQNTLKGARSQAEKIGGNAADRFNKAMRSEGAQNALSTLRNRASAVSGQVANRLNDLSQTMAVPETPSQADAPPTEVSAAPASTPEDDPQHRVSTAQAGDTTPNTDTDSGQSIPPDSPSTND